MAVGVKTSLVGISDGLPPTLVYFKIFAGVRQGSRPTRAPHAQVEVAECIPSYVAARPVHQERRIKSSGRFLSEVYKAPENCCLFVVFIDIFSNLFGKDYIVGKALKKQLMLAE